MARRSSSSKGWLKHYGELKGGWVRRSSSITDAQDAVHDAVTRMLHNGDAAVLDSRAYLYAASKNRLLGEIRRQHRAATVGFTELAEHEHPAAPDADAAVRTAQLVADLRMALEELPLKCQQVFLWNKLEGYTQAEIAEKLGLSPSMVEKYMKRALLHIQKKLQQHAPH